MRTIETNLYKFDELSDEAKQNAIDKWRNSDNDDFDFQSECSIDDFCTILNILGFDVDNMKNSKKPAIYYSVGYCQSDYANFDASYRYKKGALKAIKQYAPRCGELHNAAKTLQELQKKYFYNLYCKVKTNHRYGFSVEVEHLENSGFIYSDNVISVENEFKYIVRQLNHYLYIQLRNGLDYVNSDEYITETIINNDYEFKDNGVMI